MFRFIGAWLQAVLRYIAAWLPAAAADDSDAAVASPQAAMDFPVTASLGPLHRPLHSFRATKNNLPEGVSEGEVRRLEADLEVLFTELKIVAEADDPSFTARCWMKEVRELRYDAEDFFGEVLSSCAGARRSALLAIILWIPSKLKRRHQVAEAFSDLCARARDASRRRQSFQLGPATIKPEFGEANVSRSPKFIGLDESMDKLVKLLAFDSEDAEQQVQVVPIFGSAGVGKTTLVRTFYHKFGWKFQCRAFVRVSRNPDMRRMLSSMLSQIKAPPVHGFPDVQDLIDHIREYLQCKRYLIVIDDLWASSTWDVISRAFPDGDCCSRIIVTTEFEDVALACSRYQFKYMYGMSPLNGDQSRQLFLGRVFGSQNGCPPDFKGVAYEIIRKCGGLPLAIENIASMLACELNIDQWKHIRNSLPSILSLRTDPSSEGLNEVLSIIYDNLSLYLKTCLLYLIMYPEGNNISKDELVKQWVAEDFISEGQDREKTARDYFEELVSRGMIQPVDRNYNGEVLTCTVHHMVLDLIRYKSIEENFIINVSCFQATPGLPDKVRRLSVQFGGAKCANISADFMMTQVRSLMFFGFLNCVPSVVEYKLLRVLILHIWADESKIFDLSKIGELFQLRYLKIDGNITIHLPGEIRQLNLLETLELHAPVNDMPDISCLPLLRTLSYFDLSKNSVENVQNLGELNNLQDLHLTWSNTAKPDNLKNNMQCLGSILWKLSNLKSLTLVPAAASHADVLGNAGGASVRISGDVFSSMSSPPALLQRLELSGRCCIFSSLPEWTKDLGNLCVLKIAVRKLLSKDIDILKGLPALMALSLYIWTSPVGKVLFDDEGFSVLKYFKFTCAAPCVAFLKGAMPSVRELKLAFNANRMEQYSQIVTGLEYLIKLREITAKVGGTGADDSDKGYAESALSGAIANHPCTPIIRVQCVDRIFCGEEDTSAITQEQNHWTLKKQDEIQDELLDPLPEHLISAPSIQTQMRDGGQNEGTYRSVEVLTQEREHLILEKQQGIQEEFLDPVPKLLSTTNTSTQTRDGVQSEQIEGSKEVLKQEQEHWILKKQHEIRPELPDPLPDLLISTPSTQTQTRDGGKNGGTERSREVLTQEQEQEHWALVKQHKHQEELLQVESSRPHSIALKDLEEITDNFSKGRILGRGGFGVVYKGVLQNGKTIAVKKILSSLVPGPQMRFESEVCHLMMLKHPNIVRCVGYCYEIQNVSVKYKGKYVIAEMVEALLCLEYMPNGSLDKYLSDESSGLDWSTRYNIINGICYGLCYLHEEIDKPILHLGLKPANILLDDGMTPKITDFSLSRLLDQQQTIHTLSHFGTFGYLAPEYLHGGIVTPKSDIFSLGVIILEVVTGYKDYPDVTRTPSDDFIEHTLEKWRKVLQRSPGYVSLETDCGQIRRCIQVGLICVNPDRTKRPPITKVISMIQGLESIDYDITNKAM